MLSIFDKLQLTGTDSIDQAWHKKETTDQMTTCLCKLMETVISCPGLGERQFVLNGTYSGGDQTNIKSVPHVSQVNCKPEKC